MSNKNLTSAKFIFPTYGKALRKARKNIGLNQGEFAKKISEEQSVVSRWETTGAEPLDFNKDKISQVLNKGGYILAPCSDGWVVKPSGHDPAQKAHDDVDRVKQKASEYRAKERSLDDLPEILRLKNELEKWIDELLKDKG